MPKNTTLDDQAELYQPRKEQTEKEKLKDMSFSKKISYLWEYYKIHATITLIVVALIGYIIYTVSSPRLSPQLYTAFINNNLQEEALEEYKTAFSDYLQLNPERESIDFNTNFYFSGDAQYEMNMRQVLVTYISAQEVDIIIAPESEFTEYAYYGYFDKLSDQLPTDIYSNLTDKFYISDTEDEPEKNAYGIYLTDTDLYQNTLVDSEPYVLGIVVNSKRKDNSIEFIRFLFKDQKTD